MDVYCGIRLCRKFCIFNYIPNFLPMKAPQKENLFFGLVGILAAIILLAVVIVEVQKILIFSK